MHNDGGTRRREQLRHRLIPVGADAHSDPATVEFAAHVVTMREPHPVALQPGGIPCPSAVKRRVGLPGSSRCRDEGRSRCPGIRRPPGNEPSTGRNLSARRSASTGSSRREHQALEHGRRRYPGPPDQRRRREAGEVGDGRLRSRPAAKPATRKKAPAKAAPPRVAAPSPRSPRRRVPARAPSSPRSPATARPSPWSTEAARVSSSTRPS